jgi:hypothetical protein
MAFIQKKYAYPMRASTGIEWLESLRKRWMLLSAAKILLFSFALALLATALLRYFLGYGTGSFVIVFVIAFSTLSLFQKFWAVSLHEICRFVDRTYPVVEESSVLLITNPENLSGLQNLQRKRVNALLAEQQLPASMYKQLRVPGVLILLSAIVLFGLNRVPQWNSNALPVKNDIASPRASVKENVPPEISGYSVSITAPAYTRKPVRVQNQFSIRAEQGAMANWQIQTSAPVKNFALIWNDKQVFKLSPADQSGRSWKFSKALLTSGFYQLLLNGQKSDLYQVEIIPDQPVAIKLLAPEQHSTIDVGQEPQVGLKLLLSDDYGIADAYISATVASGKGEAVNFKEQKIALQKSFNNQKQVQVIQQLLLNRMGMKPGDELYFYIQARDNHGQQSRSDMYFVSIQDTTELMSMAAIDNGVNLVPEYFRSQRQIIIDTEKLLKERASISEADFKTRSNDLGVDQKMLRLRYGKFLGEESETNIGAAHEDEHEEHDNVEAIMDQYAHKHDNAEDATFFEPEMKKQLKATLTEMWSAELQLRTFAPQKALPYEYKALRLLKDLQQKSRAFVAKTTVKTTPLKMEKRLSGELAEISGTTNLQKQTADSDRSLNLQHALAALEAKLSGQGKTISGLSNLQFAEKELIHAAASAPSRYLPALKSLKVVIAAWNTEEVSRAEIRLAEQGINNLLGQAQARPYAAEHRPSDLSKAYFNQLAR